MKRFRFYALKLCGIILIVFLAQILFLNFTELFILNNLAFSEFWRFFSSIFLHGGLVHLFYNLFALALFGSILEKLVGGRKFLFIFFISGILANFIAVNFYDNSLGASGAIFGVIGALIVISPMMLVWAFGLPMPIFIAGILWALGDLIGAVGFLSGNPIDNTGNIAHLAGMFFGFIFGLLFKPRRGYSYGRSRNYIKFDENYVRDWEDRYVR